MFKACEKLSFLTSSGHVARSEKLTAAITLESAKAWHAFIRLSVLLSVLKCLLASTMVVEETKRAWLGIICV